MALRAIVGITLLLVVVAAPAGAVGKPPPEHYLVVLKPDITDPGAVARKHRARYGVTVMNVYRSALKGYAAAIPAGRLAQIRRDPSVAYVEADAAVGPAGQGSACRSQGVTTNPQ